MEKEKMGQRNGYVPNAATKNAGEENETELNVKSGTEEEHKYGWFCFTPGCLQIFAKGIWVCIFLTIGLTLISGTYNGLSGSAQTSIETRFGLTSTQSSWIITSYEVGNIFAGIVVAIVGSKDACHKPRWIAGGLLVGTVGCIVYTLPHFISDVYAPGEAVVEQDITCSNKTNQEDVCAMDDSPERSPENNGYVGVFIVARLLLACASAPLILLGLAYMDDCASKEAFSFYSGIFCCGWIAGPALGYICGGYSLTIFTDFPTVPEEEWIEQDDPRWVGAWWLGFLAAAAAMFIFAFPMGGFPKDLPGAFEIRMKKQSEAFDSVVNENQVQAVKNEDYQSSDIGPCLKYLFTNWTYLFLNFFIACDVGIMAGYTVFGPKLIEVLYNFTSARASALMGVLVVPSALVGTVGGGILIRKFHLTVTGIMKVQLGLSMVVILGGTCNLLSCPDADFAGVNMPYPDQEEHNAYSDYNITSSCNVHCDCEDVAFSPVCSGDDVQYYSPCHAGCTGDISEDDEYFNCSCVRYMNSTGDSAYVSDGICSTSSCRSVYGFSVLIFVVMIAIFMTAAMNISGIVRSVPRTHRLLGFVINGIIQKLIGTIPAPVIFGYIFDQSCVLWEDECDVRGACFYYDKRKLGLYIFLTCFIYKLISVIFLVLAWKLYIPPKAPVPVVLDVKLSDVKDNAANDVINSICGSKTTSFQEGTGNPAYVDCLTVGTGHSIANGGMPSSTHL